MGFSVANRKEIEAKVRASMNQFEHGVSTRLMTLCGEINEYIMSLTPVHSGQTVRNYIWTTGTAFSGVLDPIENGETGATNSMPLGVEPRRSINEEAASETLLAIDFRNPFQTFILTNNSPQVSGLELGLLPGPPMKSRSPNGMFGLTHEWVMTTINARGFVR